MSFLTSNNVVIAIFSLLIIVLLWERETRSEYLPPGTVDEMLDDNTRVLSAEIQSRDSIIDDLREESVEAADRINKLQEEIIAHAQVSGSLRIYRDSIQTLRKKLSTGEIVQIIEQGRDTTSVFAETFSDSLFKVTSSVHFSPDTIENTLDLVQLRPIRMTLTVTEGEHGQILFYSTLPDFDLSDQKVWTPPPTPPTSWYRKYWREISIGGLIAVLAIK